MHRAIIPSSTTITARCRLVSRFSSSSCAKRPKSTTSISRPPQPLKQRQQHHKKSTLAMNNNNSSMNNSSTGHQLTSQQIQSIFLSAAIPMIGFGFMDNFVMITAGNAIDNSIGIQMGLATMTAAAIGQVVSDVSGVMFGDTLSRVFKISSAQLTETQRNLAFVRRLRLAGAVLGVITGCTLGATALYFVPDRNEGVSASVSSAATATADTSSIHSSGSHPSTRQQQQQLLHRLQKVLNDVMTNQEEKWHSRDARCTLYVNGPLSNCIPVPAQNKNSSSSSIARQLSLFGNENKANNNKRNMMLIGEGTSAIIDRLVYDNRDDGRNKNDKDNYSAVMQSAKESRVVVFSNTIYVPVAARDDNNNNNDNNVLGVLKVELGQNGGSFYSTGSEIKDAKRVARNLGYFMNHF